MSTAVSVKELVTDIRVMSGLRNNQFFTDTQIASFVDDAAKQWYDKFVLSHQHYFIKTFDFTLTNSVSRVLLPTDFMKENLVVLNPGPQEIPIDALENYQMTGMQGNALEPCGGQKWFIAGDYISVYPAQMAAGSYQLRYTPTLDDLSLGDLSSLVVTPTYTVRLSTTEPLDLSGNWNASDENTMAMETFSPLPGSPVPQLRIDSEGLIVGDLILIREEHAPIDPVNMGIWQFMSVGGSGGTDTVTYIFQRPTGLIFPDTYIFISDIIAVSAGRNFGKTYWSPTNFIANGVNSSPVVSLTNIDFNGSATSFALKLANGQFDSSAVGGTVSIEGARVLSNDGTWNINGTLGGQVNTLLVQDLTSTLSPEDFPWDATISVNPVGTRSTIPTLLLPWVLYLKVHASVAVRTGRQQDCQDLQLKLQQQEKRIEAIASNRSERVIQAPVTRGRVGGNCHGDGSGNGF